MPVNVLTPDEAAGRRPPDPPPPDDTPPAEAPREYTVVVTVTTTDHAAHLDAVGRLAATVRDLARERPGALPASTVEMRSGEPS